MTVDRRHLIETTFDQNDTLSKRHLIKMTVDKKKDLFLYVSAIKQSLCYCKLD